MNAMKICRLFLISNILLSHVSGFVPTRAFLADQKQRGGDVKSLSVLKLGAGNEEESSSKSLSSINLSNRLNTMETAFGRDNYQLSSKVAIAIGMGYLLIKIVRARVMKRGKTVLSAMPTWGYLVSSKEEEMEFLHAYCCKQCGTTIFPARGRDAKFFPKDIECFSCGAKGREMFFDRRKDMDIGDDVDYLSPYDYMSDAEKKIAKLKEENERMAELAKKRAEEEAWLNELAEEEDDDEDDDDDDDDDEYEDDDDDDEEEYEDDDDEEEYEDDDEEDESDGSSNEEDKKSIPSSSLDDLDMD